MDSEVVLAVAVVVVVQVAIALWLRNIVRDAGRHAPSIAAPPSATGQSGPRDGLRRADDFRSYQAVAAEVAKRQVQVLAEMDSEIQAYERACLAHARRLCELLIAEGRRAGHSGLPTSAPNDLESAMQALLAVSTLPIDDAAQQRHGAQRDRAAHLRRADAESARGAPFLARHDDGTGAACVRDRNGPPVRRSGARSAHANGERAALPRADGDAP